jgi:hypothetical protein
MNYKNNSILGTDFDRFVIEPSKILNYTLVFLLVATSGITYFYYNEQYIVIGLILSVLIAFSRGTLEELDLKFFLILLLFMIWQIFQGFYFENFTIKSLIGTFVRFAFAYLVIKTVGHKLIPIYINLIVFFSIISLLVYVAFFFPSLTNQLVAHAIKSPLFPLKDQTYAFTPNYILVTFNQYQQLRNSGPFWEPGAFAVFLNVAILFNVMSNKKLFDKKNILFIISIATTLSTAGYLALFFIITLIYLIVNPSLKKVLILAPMVVFFTIFIINMSFLLPKIKDNVIIAENDNTSRFGSAYSDYQLIYKNPIIGYGKDIQNKFGTSIWNLKKMHRNNGITNFMTEWGLVIFVFYFANCKKSFNNICLYYQSNKNLSIVMLITILLSGFSEAIFQYTFFYSLMFLQFSYNGILVKNELETEPNIQSEELFVHND